MSRTGALPPDLVAVLRAPVGSCYRHCREPVRVRRLSSPMPGIWQVLACPSGVVSVTSYTEWTRSDPTARARAFLRSRTVPSSLVRPTDLRLATRHGPELGRSAERRLAADPGHRPVRVVYWRVYPFDGPEGKEHRLFLCARRAHAAPVFYTAPADRGPDACPVCAERPRRARRPVPRGRSAA